jgi:hypothetical protein
MTLRYSDAIRDAGLDARVAAIGPSPHLKIFAEKEPEEISLADPGEPLITFVLPKSWMKKASNGIAMNSGLWPGTATSDGKAKSFRLCDAAGNVHMQGAIPEDLKLDNDNIRKGQEAAVRVFVLAAGNG